MDRDGKIDEFAEEVWDCVCRLRVGSGLTNKDIIKALNRVKVLIHIEIHAEGEDE